MSTEVNEKELKEKEIEKEKEKKAKEKAKAEKKKNKEPVSGFDIFSRILTCLAALAVPVVAYFTNIIYYVVESTVFAIYAQIKGDTTDDGSTYGLLSIHKIVHDYLPLLKDLPTSKERSFAELWESLALVRTGIILTLVFFALAILTALVIFFISALTKSNKAPMICGLIGFIFTLGMYFAFRGVSLPIINGAVSMEDFFGSSIITAILPFLASFSELHLGTAWVLMMVIFFCIFVWHGALLLIGSDSKQPKKK